MLIQEVNWLRSHAKKLCPFLKRTILDQWYRPHRRIPCFIHRPFKYFYQRWRKIPVIVQFEPTRDCESAKDIAQTVGCPVERELKLINAFSTRVNIKNLQLLLQDKNVKKVWYDREVRAVLDTASTTVQAKTAWPEGITGKSIGVAVLDTGIYNHPDLAGRIVAFKDFIKNETSPYDDNGHGTHVAGDIASNGSQSDSRYRAPASEANIIGVKVLDKMGSGSISNVIDGVQWSIENSKKYNIRILNLSLGSEATESYQDDPLCLALEKAWNNGLVVCAAAGNDGPDTKTINSPGIHPKIITVGAVNDRNNNMQIADFSSRGPTVDGLRKPDVLAPGVNIVSLRAPGSTTDNSNKHSRVDAHYTSLSGTSMATPICAGVIAQMLQVNPNLKPDQVKNILMSTARKLPNVDQNVQGEGVIDAGKAINRVK